MCDVVGHLMYLLVTQNVPYTSHYDVACPLLIERYVLRVTGKIRTSKLSFYRTVLMVNTLQLVRRVA